jgi:hypothetical protein
VEKDQDAERYRGPEDVLEDEHHHVFSRILFPHATAAEPMAGAGFFQESPFMIK